MPLHLSDDVMVLMYRVDSIRLTRLATTATQVTCNLLFAILSAVSLNRFRNLGSIDFWFIFIPGFGRMPIVIWHLEILRAANFAWKGIIVLWPNLHLLLWCFLTSCAGAVQREPADLAVSIKLCSFDWVRPETGSSVVPKYCDLS